jgi:hypothetical protein
MSKYKAEVETIRDHLTVALQLATNLITKVHAEEGDSDLHRKLSFYLAPSLDHWITGTQAGNMKDLFDTLTRREVEETKKKLATPNVEGDGHEVMTAPTK